MAAWRPGAVAAGHDAPPLLSSFDIDAWRRRRRPLPELPRAGCCWMMSGATATGGVTAGWAACRSTFIHQLLDGVASGQPGKPPGLHILVYTVNKPQRAAGLLRWGVDTHCTDAIDVIGPASTFDPSADGRYGVVCRCNIPPLLFGKSWDEFKITALLDDPLLVVC